MPIKMKSPKGMPTEMMEVAEESDTVFESAIPAPEKPYSPKTADSLAKALVQVAKVFGLPPTTPAPYSGPVTELDPEVVQVLMMVDEAARDFGRPLPVAPSEIKSDNDLVAITAHITGLARDPDFREFLKMDAAEDVTDEPSAPEGEAAPFDFASRMKA